MDGPRPVGVGLDVLGGGDHRAMEAVLGVTGLVER